MASGGKRGGAGERVLESRHVIGLFMLMLLFSGVFFTLGYVMGRSQYDGQVRAALDPRSKPEGSASGHSEPAPKRANKPAPSETSTDSTAKPNPDWEFYNAGNAKRSHDELKPVGTPAPVTPNPTPAVARTSAPSKTAPSPSKPSSSSSIPAGQYTLQVAALTKEADAVDLATRLQKKNFPAFVLSPRTDKYYHVQVGPYVDQKAAEAARKGLEGAGFKAIVKH
jgi:septal ring-binding cell division protein DamX